MKSVAEPPPLTPNAQSGDLALLTFHGCINYGSYWQTRCLVEGLRRRGHDPVIADHHSWRVNRAEWRCALHPVPNASVFGRDRIRYAAKALKFARAVATLPRSERFSLGDPVGMARYETVVVGSDEVWNLQHPWYGGASLFFGDGVRARRLVAYAASFGSYPADAGLEPHWVEKLRRFDAISVRDDNSRRVVENALGRDTEMVLDPCLQFPPAADADTAADARWRRPDRPFIALYGHSFSPAFVQQVRRWAHTRRRRIVSIGYRNNWADENWISAGPHDFARCMTRADAVATNFFHGCVFALINARPFICEPSSYRFIKIWNLLRQVGAEQQLVTDDTPPAVVDRRLDESLDPAVLRRVDELRQASSAYLDRALGSAVVDSAPAALRTALRDVQVA